MLTCFSAALNILAQDDPEYRMEIGVGAGLSGYLGDFNGNLTKNLQPMATVLGRYVFNPYTAIRMNVSYGKMKGSSKGIQTYYPAFASTPYEFNNTIYTCTNIIANLSNMLEPLIPEKTERIRKYLKLDKAKWEIITIDKEIDVSNSMEILFERIK